MSKFSALHSKLTKDGFPTSGVASEVAVQFTSFSVKFVSTSLNKFTVIVILEFFFIGFVANPEKKNEINLFFLINLDICPNDI